MKDIQHTALFQAPIEKVWNAVATAEGIASWFMANDFQPQEGHEFVLQSPFGPSPCKVLHIEAPHKLTFSWDKDGWVVQFILRDLGDGKTEFTLVHGGWKPANATISKANEDSSVIRDRMDGGWANLVHEKLKKVVEA